MPAIKKIVAQEQGYKRSVWSSNQREEFSQI